MCSLRLEVGNNFFGRLLRSFALVQIGILPMAVCAQEEDQEPVKSAPVDPRIVEVRFTDDSRLKVVLADERIELETTHGKLSIPAEEVRVIDFAQRLTEEQKQEVDRWIADLG